MSTPASFLLPHLGFGNPKFTKGTNA